MKDTVGGIEAELAEARAAASSAAVLEKQCSALKTKNAELDEEVQKVQSQIQQVESELAIIVRERDQLKKSAADGEATSVELIALASAAESQPNSWQT